jgi:hypothetical protein
MILGVIERFQALAPEERDIYKLGRRLGVYDKIDDLNDTARHEEVDLVLAEIDKNTPDALDKVLYNLMERYV